MYSKYLYDYEIKEIVPGVRTILYEQLMNIDRLDRHTIGNGLCILFPGKSRKSGHWVCLYISNDNRKIIYFDSYGSPKGRLEQAEDYNLQKWDPRIKRRLTRLLYESPYEIEYNEYQLQSADPKISSCGYWICARLLMKDLSVTEFAYLWRIKDDGTLPDDLVVYYINHMI